MLKTEMLMKHSGDWAWVDEYEKRIGWEVMFDYHQRIFKFLYELPDNSKVIIDKTVKPSNRDLFAKLVCMYVHSGYMNIIFDSDYTVLIKLNNATPVTRRL